MFEKSEKSIFLTICCQSTKFYFILYAQLSLISYSLCELLWNHTLFRIYFSTSNFTILISQPSQCHSTYVDQDDLLVVTSLTSRHLRSGQRAENSWVELNMIVMSATISETSNDFLQSTSVSALSSEKGSKPV